MKTILLVIALFAMSAYGAIEPQNRSTNLAVDGSVISSSLEKEFINVVNGEGATISAGMIVVLDLTADDGATVNIDSSASQTPICMMVKDCPDNKLCKCQTYGKFDAALYDSTDGNAVAGAPFFNSTNTAGYIGEVVLGGVEIPAGVFYDAASASAAVEVFLKMK